jgi:4-hydroxy-2-oxoheptanedioate aldolase
MKTNPVKHALREGKPTFGTWLSLGDLHSARVLARLGFDWLTLDLEHSPIDWSQAAAIFGAVADAGCVPLVRVPEGNPMCIKRALDAGAFGIVVPMVETVQQAQTAIAAAKLPPLGNRSAGAGLHALNFAATPDEYFARANDEILVVLQTESPLGVKNAEEIYRLPGCDAIFVGPLDLRFTMRSPDGRFPLPEEHEAMIQQVIRIGHRLQMPTGLHCRDPREALRRAEQGMQFLAVSSDLGMMTAKAKETLEIVRAGKEDWWQFLQRTRAELERTGHQFRSKEDIDAEIDSLRSGDERIDDLRRQMKPQTGT